MPLLRGASLLASDKAGQRLGVINGVDGAGATDVADVAYFTSETARNCYK
jgi:hypothetical protein